MNDKNLVTTKCDVVEGKREEEVLIEIKIGCSSVEESNNFLRLLNQRLDDVVSTGWNPIYMKLSDMNKEYKYKNNGFLLGYSNSGEHWFDYKERGCIDNYYIKTRKSLFEKVNEAVAGACKFRETVKKKYTVRLSFCTDFMFSKMCKNNILFYSKRKSGISGKISKEKYITFIEFCLEGYGEKDVKYCATQVLTKIVYVFCAFTNYVLKNVSQIEICSKEYDYQDTVWDNYDIGWMDGVCDFPSMGDEIGIIPDFFDLCQYIILGDENKTINRIINSARQIYVGCYMKDNIEFGNQPGVADAINAIFVSALEPLAVIKDDAVGNCEKCGQKIYSIAKRVNTLSEKYFGSGFTSKYTKKVYQNRSKYLHEGLPITDGIYQGFTWNQFDKCTKKIKKPVALIDYNLSEYVSYVFRQEVLEFLSNEKKIKNDVLN